MEQENRQPDVIAELGGIVLTKSCVRFSNKSLAISSFTSMTLDSVASCEFTAKSHPMLIVLGAALLVLSLFFTSENGCIFVVLALAGAALIIAFFHVREQMFRIASNGGGAIEFVTNGTSFEDLARFSGQIEIAKIELLRDVGGIRQA
jgi:hypothetical protein